MSTKIASHQFPLLVAVVGLIVLLSITTIPTASAFASTLATVSPQAKGRIPQVVRLYREFADVEDIAATTVNIATPPPPVLDLVAVPTSPPTKPSTVLPTKRPTIERLTTLDEIKYFLEEDDSRPASLFVYAPFCKSCQRLMKHYDKLAKDYGDGIVSRRKVEGKIRCAKIEYNQQTKSLITDTLQIAKVPTLQLYSGLNKVWENSGTTNTKELRSMLHDLDLMSSDELQDYAEDVDDGILQDALEDTFFDDLTPDFLNDEW